MLRKRLKNILEEFRAWILLERSMTVCAMPSFLDFLPLAKPSCLVFVFFLPHWLGLLFCNDLGCVKVAKKNQMPFPSSVLFLGVLWTSLLVILVRPVCHFTVDIPSLAPVWRSPLISPMRPVDKTEMSGLLTVSCGLPFAYLSISTTSHSDLALCSLVPLGYL